MIYLNVRNKKNYVISQISEHQKAKFEQTKPEEMNQNNDALSNVPTKWRMKCFNNEGKQFLLPATSLTEHNLPVSGTLRRCIMCSCETTVLWGTRNAHL